MDSNNAIDSSEESEANTVHNSPHKQQDANGNPVSDIICAVTTLLLGGHVNEGVRRLHAYHETMARMYGCQLAYKEERGSSSERFEGRPQFRIHVPPSHGHLVDELDDVACALGYVKSSQSRYK